MDAELDPLCAKYRVTKKQGIGFDSVTSVTTVMDPTALPPRNRGVPVTKAYTILPSGRATRTS